MLLFDPSVYHLRLVGKNRESSHDLGLRKFREKEFTNGIQLEGTRKASKEQTKMEELC
jgi:hypothetical protein